MKKRADYVPLELSGAELDRFVANLRDKLFSEFWSDYGGSPGEKVIKSRLEKNIYSAFDSVLK